MNILKSISVALRKSLANRRRADRHNAQRKAQLIINLSLAGAAQVTMPHEGYTRDLSKTGLSIIIPSLRINGRYLNSEDCSLRIVLPELPAAEIYATPVRYAQLEQSGRDASYFIALRITKMSETDRTRYETYLRSLK